jgi:hypothetical protein
MMLFSDEIGRLYLIFVDTNKKQTWVPLPSSRLTRHLASVPVESAPSGKPGVSTTMEVQGTAQRHARCLLPQPETSTGDEVFIQPVLSGSA